MTHAQLIAAASGAALRAHRRFNIDRRKRVDVFHVLRLAGIEVFFRPLNRICGAYIPTGGYTPGVLINSKLPLSRQRYTAAHEFGHFFLGHKSASIDKILERITIEERESWSAEESIAETFAAFFLMPAGLVDASLRELGAATLTAQNIYFLALKMGTSYLATVNQLHTLKRISFADAERLRRQQPKLIKKSVSLQPIGRCDVWLIDEQWNGQSIFPAADDTIILRLAEIPTSGYAWDWRGGPESLVLLRDGFHDESTDLVGGSRIREFVAKVAEIAAPEHLSLVRSQSWDAESVPSARFSLNLVPQARKKTGPLTVPSLRRAG
jgi:predicted secreted protein